MKRNLLPLIVLSLTIVSCHSTVTSPGEYHGMMTGRFLSLDVNGDSITSLNAGTSVWLQGTNYRTVTDTNANWSLNNVAAGIYTILFTRPGFDTNGFVNHPFSGAGVDFIPQYYLYRLPTDSIVLDYFSVRDTSVGGASYPMFFYSGHVSSGKQQLYSIFCTVDSTSTDPSLAGGPGWAVGGKFSGATAYAMDIPQARLSSTMKGHTVFLRAQLGSPGAYEYLGTSPLVMSPHLSNTLSVSVP